jgi:thioesterase domain-containing protein
MTWPQALTALLRNLPYWFMDDFLHTDRHEMLTRLRRRARTVQRRLARLLGPARQAPAQSALDDIYGIAAHVPEHNRPLLETHWRTLTHYVPRVYPGRITLFRARAQDLFFMQKPDLGWGELALGGVDIKIIPGSHVTIMRQPHIHVLRAQLRAALEQAEGIT